MHGVFILCDCGASVTWALEQGFRNCQWFLMRLVWWAKHTLGECLHHTPTLIAMTAENMPDEGLSLSHGGYTTYFLKAMTERYSGSSFTCYSFKSKT